MVFASLAQVRRAAWVAAVKAAIVPVRIQELPQAAMAKPILAAAAVAAVLATTQVASSGAVQVAAMAVAALSSYVADIAFVEQR